MISHIEVSGFRSLENFSLTLKPGVNILVGPNGAGKTNILAFFEFLRHLTYGNASQAVSMMGGANAIFRKTPIADFDFDFNCKAKVYGSVSIDKGVWISYLYEFELNLATILDSLTLTKQVFSARIRNKQNTGRPKDSSWAFTASHSVSVETGETSTKVKISDQGFFQNFESSLPPAFRKTKVSETSLASDLSSYIEDGSSLVPRIGRIISGLENKVLTDFRGGTIFNIVPSQAKIEEDITKTPRIERSGAGIYATLQVLEKLANAGPRRERFLSQLPWTLQRFEQITHDDIVALLKLASDSITDYKVVNDPFDNKLQVRITLKGNNKDDSMILPLSSMSDGTVKWLALVLITLTSISNFSVEEPENYLHPRMQQEFLRLLRSKISEDTAALVSTHSETLLNSCSPNEIIVVSFAKGRTHASRPKNSKLLSQEISETGFGLGYYYVAGALEAE